MHKNALVYGFGPYANYPHNITIDVIDRVKQLKIAPAVIFETRFSRKMFDSVLQKHQPQLIIGLGQDSRAKKIRIERRAINWQKSSNRTGRPISKHSARYQYVPLKVASVPGTTIAYDAGDFVCNYSMYLMCEYCLNTDNMFAFLHLPLSVNVSRAASLVENIMQASSLLDLGYRSEASGKT